MDRLAFIRWMNESPVWFWLVFAFAAYLALGGLFKGFQYFYRKRVIQDTPTSKIRSTVQGYVEIRGRGKLMEGPSITAPLTGKICTWYKYEIAKRTTSGHGSSWEVIEERESEELFLLEDDTGECIIDPEGADVTATAKQVWYGNSRQDHVRGASFARRIFAHRFNFRFMEYRMHPGDPLYALGLFKTSGGAGGKLDVNQDVLGLIKEWKADSQALLSRFDKNKDGQIDMDEWQAVRDEAYKQVMHKHRELETQPAFSIMGQTLDNRRPYLLSVLPQSDLVKRMHYRAIIWIIVFFAAGITATWLLGLKIGN